MDDLLKITAIPSNKSKIKLNPLQEANVIPRHPFSTIFNGRSGSGKSNLLITLLTRQGMYKDFFDQIYLFAGSPDESFQLFGVKKEHTFTDSKKWDGEIKKICKAQEDLIERKQIHNTDKILFIFEDIINHAKFMRTSKNFSKLFFAGRHYNASIMITTQSWTRIPRALRMQAFAIFYFKGTDSEKRLLAEEFAPSNLTAKEFAKKIIDDATKNPYNFLSIYTRLPEDERFRKNLEDIYLV